MTFSQVVMEVMRQLEGAYALIFKSPHYPNELIACKRGSQLILGVNVSERTSLYPSGFWSDYEKIKLIFFVCLYSATVSITVGPKFFFLVIYFKNI